MTTEAAFREDDFAVIDSEKAREETADTDAADRPVRRALVRRVVLGVVFMVAAVGIVLGSGWGTLSSFGWESIATICPLGALESMLAGKLLIPRALVFLLVFAAVAVLLGKVFCAWVCPVPPTSRIIDSLRRRVPRIHRAKTLQSDGTERTTIRVVRPLSRKERKALKASCTNASAASGGTPVAEAASDAISLSPSSTDSAAGACTPSACASCASGCSSASRPALDSRHVVLGGSLLTAAIFGFPVFCLVCPIGLTFATIIVFTQLFGLQTLSWGLVLFPLLLVLELTVLRKWCGRFCPMGALMSLFARPNRTLRPKVDEHKCLRSHGVDCQVCTGVCPEGLDPHTTDAMHECSKCKDCAVNCPAHAISFPAK